MVQLRCSRSCKEGLGEEKGIEGGERRTEEGGQAGRTREGKKRKWERGQKKSVPAPQMGGIHGNKTFSIEG